MNINYLAVFVAAIAANLIGMFWYSPAGFGKAWKSLVGLSQKDLEKAKEKGMACAYLAHFVASVVMVGVLAIFIEKLGVSDAWLGVHTAFWAWLGFMAPIVLGSVLWEGKSSKLFVLNGAYWLTTMLVAGAIIGGWV